MSKSKLDELRDIVAKAFEGAETKESIETFANINNKLDEVGKENEELFKRNEELVKSYKDLIKHTSFSDPKTMSNNDITPTPISFEQALSNFMTQNK